MLFHNVNELEVVLVHSLLQRAVSCANAIDQASADEPFVSNTQTSDASSANAAPQHQVFTVAKSRHSVQTASGLTLTPTWAFMGAPPLDVLIVPSGAGLPLRDKDKQLFSYLEQKSQQVEVVVGLGSGVAVLGECGLLRGLNVSAPAHLHNYLEQYEILQANEDVLTVVEVQGDARADSNTTQPDTVARAPQVWSAPQIWSARGGLSSSELTAALIESLFGAYIKDTVMSKLS
ncbi:MAG: hypothetical protein AAF267_04480 [Deinococcota bacterium]